MSSDSEKNGEGTETVGQRLDTLSASVDERFDAVDAALVEQRQYTEFAFDRLAGEMKAGFEAGNGRLDGVDARLNAVDRRLVAVDSRFDRVDSRLETVDRRFDAVDSRFDEVERKFDGVERRFDGVDSRFDTVESRFDRLERKLDQFIDVQSTANKLVERRLTALEPRSAHE